MLVACWLSTGEMTMTTHWWRKLWDHHIVC